MSEITDQQIADYLDIDEEHFRNLGEAFYKEQEDEILEAIKRNRSVTFGKVDITMLPSDLGEQLVRHDGSYGALLRLGLETYGRDHVQKARLFSKEKGVDLIDALMHRQLGPERYDEFLRNAATYGAYEMAKNILNKRPDKPTDPKKFENALLSIAGFLEKNAEKSRLLGKAHAESGGISTTMYDGRTNSSSIQLLDYKRGGVSSNKMKNKKRKSRKTKKRRKNKAHRNY